MDKPRNSGWQGVCLIVITYVYFLIFAQFAFLQRLAELGIAGDHLRGVMGAMALGGIALSLLTPRTTLLSSPSLRLRIGLALCGLAAFLSVLPLDFPGGIALAALIGCGLGLLTVTLVTYLPLWLGSGNLLFKVGLGTGTAYFICNVPSFFAASPQVQAITSALLCLAGVALAGKQNTQSPAPDRSRISFIAVLACFTALIWLDSAAFFIIQSNATLKAGTWQGNTHLWTNGLLHFAAALASSWLLRRNGDSLVLPVAYLSLAAACLLLPHTGLVILASIFYPIGVSLYSVALVAYPSLLASASSEAERGRKAGWIYSIAGWIGSALGIGMGQNLGSVPPAFVFLAGIIIALSTLTGLLRRRKREIASVAALLLLSFFLYRAMPGVKSQSGRQVYISEGCINCHSQYVRPSTADVLMWGPVQSISELRLERPPLIGNRRQGPDLAQVGARRSPLWLKIHLIHPSAVSHNSFMPSYAYLFQDQRGDDLVRYLQSLGSANTQQHVSAEAAWVPSSNPAGNANQLFQEYCATCHAPTGQTRVQWRSSFKRIPPNLSSGLFLPANRIAKIIKFGIAGTDMPGHEYMPDGDIAALTRMLCQCKSKELHETQPGDVQ